MPTRLEREISRVRHGDHLCLIYRDRQEQMAAAVPFVRDGLRVGDRCVYIADDQVLADVRGALEQAGIDVAHEEGRGALQLLTKRDTYLREGRFDPDGMIRFLAAAERQAVEEGFAGLRVTGEMTWALGGGAGADRLVEYEAKLNSYFPGSRALAICQYSEPRFPPEVLRDVLLTHPVAVVGERVCTNPYFRPEQVRGGSGAMEDVAWMLEQLQALHAAEEALETARRQVATNEKLSAMGMLVSGVAHELRTPLTYSMTNLQLIERLLDERARPEDAALRAHVAQAIEGLDRLGRIVANLRRFMRTARHDGAPGDLAEVAATATDFFLSTVPHRVFVRTDLQVARVEKADPFQLQQVVLNLLSNAAEAIGPAGGQVRVRTRSDGAGAVLEVEDDGPGMPPEVRSRLFEPLFTTKPDGTGLGLSIVQRIVQEHGGRIDVDSAPGKGSRFTVRFPAAPPGGA